MSSDNMKEGFVIRPAKDLDEALSLWWPLLQSLGWNRSSYDLETYLKATHSSGLLLVVPESTKTPEGNVMATIHDNSTGWVTTFIVNEGYRGLGYGRALFDAAMNEFAEHKVKYVGLDAVAQQKKTYERRGFQESPLGLIRIMLRSLEAHAPLPAAVSIPDGSKLVDIQDIPTSLLVQSDLEHTGFERKGLWTKDFIQRPDLLGVALVKDGSQLADLSDILAWVVVRRASLGFRVGPVYATNPEAAKVILGAAMQKATPELIQRTPLINDELSGMSIEAITESAQLTAEMWDGNPSAMNVFNSLGWHLANVDYHRMWLHGKATKEQDAGGLGCRGMFAVFDAAVG